MPHVYVRVRHSGSFCNKIVWLHVTNEVITHTSSRMHPNLSAIRVHTLVVASQGKTRLQIIGLLEVDCGTDYAPPPDFRHTSFCARHGRNNCGNCQCSSTAEFKLCLPMMDNLIQILAIVRWCRYRPGLPGGYQYISWSKYYSTFDPWKNGWTTTKGFCLGITCIVSTSSMRYIPTVTRWGPELSYDRCPSVASMTSKSRFARSALNSRRVSFDCVRKSEVWHYPNQILLDSD